MIPAPEVTEAVPVQAVSITTEDGRTWTRLPEPWVERAGWCGAEHRYRGRTVAYSWRVIRCLEQAVWTDGHEGRCSAHMKALVVL